MIDEEDIALTRSVLEANGGELPDGFSKPDEKGNTIFMLGKFALLIPG